MPYRDTPFMNESFYHVFNRGVEKREIFSSERDYKRFLETLYYYQFSGPKPKFSNRDRFKTKDFGNNPKIVDIVCYCLMPNHFHLLVKQTQEDGVKEFMQKVINSYTKYYNTKHERVGHLFQGVFKAVAIESDEQLLQVSRYIHLNPYVSNLTNELESFPFSSYPHFIGNTHDSLCVTEEVMNFFKSPNEYRDFITSSAAYAQEIGFFKNLLLDLEE